MIYDQTIFTYWNHFTSQHQIDIALIRIKKMNK